MACLRQELLERSSPDSLQSLPAYNLFHQLSALRTRVERMAQIKFNQLQMKAYLEGSVQDKQGPSRSEDYAVS